MPFLRQKKYRLYVLKKNSSKNPALFLGPRVPLWRPESCHWDQGPTCDIPSPSRASSSHLRIDLGERPTCSCEFKEVLSSASRGPSPHGIRGSIASAPEEAVSHGTGAGGGSCTVIATVSKALFWGFLHSLTFEAPTPRCFILASNTHLVERRRKRAFRSIARSDSHDTSGFFGSRHYITTSMSSR